MNWREFPFVRLLVVFAFGIVLSVYVDRPVPYPFLAGISLMVLVWLSRNLRGLYQYRWIFGAALSIFLGFTGYQITWRFNELHKEDHFSRILPADQAWFSGWVSESPSLREHRVKVYLRVLAAGKTPGAMQPCSGNMLVYVRRDSMAETLQYGDILAIKAKVNPAEPPQNPFAFDYSRYLHFQNLHYMSYLQAGDWQKIGENAGNPILAMAIRQQKHFQQILKKYLSADEGVLAVGSALILGYRDEMPEEIRTSYAETGAMHVLAVSGLHVGIVAMLLHFFIGRIRWHSPIWKVAKNLLPIAGIWGFALLTGASPSVMRATVMFSFVSIGMAFRRRLNFYNTLAVSAFCLLCYNPYWLFSVSFQLSYAAVFGIVYFTPKMERLLRIKNKAIKYIWQLNCVSVGATITTLPLTLYYFHQFPIWFWLSSLILVPLAGFELFLGLFLLLADLIWAAAAVWIGKILFGLLYVGNSVVFFLHDLPVAVVRGIWVNTELVLLLYVVMATGMMAFHQRKFRWLLSGLALLVVASMIFSFRSLPGNDYYQMVIYHVNKHTAIDFFEGRRVYSLTDTGISEKSLRFAAEGLRLRNGSREVHSFSISEPTLQQIGSWFFHKNFAQFPGIRLYILNHELPSDSPHHRLKVDYLLFCGSPKVNLARIQEFYEAKTIVFDASNKRAQIQRWHSECEQIGQDCHDITTKGALWIKRKFNENWRN